MKILKVKKCKAKEWKQMAYDIGYFDSVLETHFIIEITEDELRGFLDYKKYCKEGK